MLQDALNVILETLCTKLLHGLHWGHSVFAYIGKKAGGKFQNFITFRVCFPLFNAYQLLFKYAYAFSELRLFLLTGKCNATDVKQLSVDLGYCFKKITGFSKLLRSLDDVNKCFSARAC